MKKRLLSIFTALALCTAFVPAPALGEGVTGSGGGLVGSPEEGGSAELNNGYNKGEDPGSGLIGAREGSATNGVTEVSTAEALASAVKQGGVVKLTADVDISATLAISGSVELDLNGYVLRYENAQAYGSVLKVESGGSLTIKDSNPSSTYNFKPNDDGLWVLDEANGTEEVKGGVITGGTGTGIGHEKRTYGGGVYVALGGELTMEGGNIVGCCATYGGGGVNLDTDNSQKCGKFTMGGGYIVGCTADYGGGVAVRSGCKLTMHSGAIIRNCTARNGGGVNIDASSSLQGEFTLKGGSIQACKAIPMVAFHNSCGGGVSNDGKFIMESGTIENCTSPSERDGNKSSGVRNGTSSLFMMHGGTINGNVKNDGALDVDGGTINGEVTGSGTVSLTVGVSGEEEFLDALEKKNVTTIKLKGDITVNEGDALTVDRPITIVNGSGYAGCDLRLSRPLIIKKGGALMLESRVSFYPYGNVTVEGSLTIGANFEVLFEGDNASLTISDGGKVTTCAAEEGKTSGLLSLDKGTKLAIAANGKMDNQGVLSISDIENLRKAADVGGDLCLYRMTVTEDYDLDMKDRLLIISGLLNFKPGANLTVKNASKVDARGTEISGGSYYCPVYAGDEPSAGGENAISGGSFYGQVMLRYQGSSDGATPSFVSGGTFYGTVEGGACIIGGTFYESVKLTGWPDSTYVSGGTFYNGLPVDNDGKQVSIDGRIVTFMNDGAKYAMQVVANGGTASAPDVPNKAGYTFAGWYTEDGKKFDFGNDIVTGDITLAAQWTSNGSDWSPSYAVVVPDDPSHGSVAVSAKYAYRGSTVTITVAPDAGYTLETLVATDARGNELALTDRGDGTFTFSMPGSKVEVKASFMEDNSLLNLFFDVPNDAYYYEAVKWAAASGIAQGYGNGLFGPNDPCTRGQVVTFLWRAAGCPEPSAPSSFSDVSQDAYYAKAVAWAVEAGIAHGYSSDAFGPDDVCTRGQVATFLWRAAGSPESAASSGFADVAEGAYYADAVAWAAENGIAHGYDSGLFGPDDGCTRGQAVTFLWRANS